MLFLSIMQKQINFSKIKKLWKANKNPIQIYIHSAFCKSICNYCMCHGNVLSSKNKELYNKYFYKYLPKQIDKYKKLIKNQYVNSIYFGGGTSSIEEDFVNLMPTFEKLRDIKCNEKTIELHMGLPITDKTIEIIKNEKFTSVILCQQTFDEEKLKQENRLNNANNDFDTLVKKFHDIGIDVGMDLIAFNDDKHRIIDDLKKVASLQNKPDEISINVAFQEKAYSYLTKECTDSLIGAGYVIGDDIKSPEELATVRSIRFVQKSKFKSFYNTFFSFVPYIFEINDVRSCNASILGIGSIPNMIRQTYSRIGDKVYSETWDGKNTDYRLYAPWSYKDQIAKLLEALPDYVPMGTEIHIEQPHIAFTSKINVDEGPLDITIKYPTLGINSAVLQKRRTETLAETQEKLNKFGLGNTRIEDKRDFWMV